MWGNNAIGYLAAIPRHGVAYSLKRHTITDLGTLGGSESIAVGIYRNLVTGWASLPGDASTHTFLYDLCTDARTDLGTLGGANSIPAAFTKGIIVGWALTSDGNQHAAVWLPSR